MTMRASEDVARSAVRRIDDLNFIFRLHAGPKGGPGGSKGQSKSPRFRAKVSDIILHEVKAHQDMMCSLDHLVYMIYRKTCLFLSGYMYDDLDDEDVEPVETFSGMPIVDFCVLLNRLEKGKGSNRQILTQYIADRVVTWRSPTPRAAPLVEGRPVAWSDDWLVNMSYADYVSMAVEPSAQLTEEPHNQEEEHIADTHADPGAHCEVLSKWEKEWADIVAISSSVEDGAM